MFGHFVYVMCISDQKAFFSLLHLCCTQNQNYEVFSSHFFQVGKIGVEVQVEMISFLLFKLNEPTDFCYNCH